MATGPEDVYPYRHKAFAEEMYQIPGCALITDYPPGTAPLAIHFLRRNRIIAGMSNATVLIESKIKGGGMMTARLAFSYDRDVFALPGRVDDIRSQGCNMLIRSKIAEPLISTQDFLDSLGMKHINAPVAISDMEALNARYRCRVTDDKLDMLSRLLIIIRNKRGITVEDLSLESGLDYATTVELTSILEIDGFINRDLLQRCCINIRKNR
jgi:DNA processing protein